MFDIPRKQEQSTRKMSTGDDIERHTPDYFYYIAMSAANTVSDCIMNEHPVPVFKVEGKGSFIHTNEDKRGGNHTYEIYIADPLLTLKIIKERIGNEIFNDELTEEDITHTEIALMQTFLRVWAAHEAGHLYSGTIVDGMDEYYKKWRGVGVDNHNIAVYEKIAHTVMNIILDCQDNYDAMIRRWPGAYYEDAINYFRIMASTKLRGDIRNMHPLNAFIEALTLATAMVSFEDIDLATEALCERTDDELVDRLVRLVLPKIETMVQKTVKTYDWDEDMEIEKADRKSAILMSDELMRIIHHEFGDDLKGIDPNTLPNTDMYSSSTSMCNGEDGVIDMDNIQYVQSNDSSSDNETGESQNKDSSQDGQSGQQDGSEKKQDGNQESQTCPQCKGSGCDDCNQTGTSQSGQQDKKDGQDQSKQQSDTQGQQDMQQGQSGQEQSKQQSGSQGQDSQKSMSRSGSPAKSGQDSQQGEQKGQMGDSGASGKQDSSISQWTDTKGGMSDSGTSSDSKKDSDSKSDNIDKYKDIKDSAKSAAESTIAKGGTMDEARQSAMESIKNALIKSGIPNNEIGTIANDIVDQVMKEIKDSIKDDAKNKAKDAMGRASKTGKDPFKEGRNAAKTHCMNNGMSERESDEMADKIMKEIENSDDSDIKSNIGGTEAAGKKKKVDIPDRLKPIESLEEIEALMKDVSVGKYDVDALISSVNAPTELIDKIVKSLSRTYDRRDIYRGKYAQGVTAVKREGVPLNFHEINQRFGKCFLSGRYVDKYGKVHTINNDSDAVVNRVVYELDDDLTSDREEQPYRRGHNFSDYMVSAFIQEDIDKLFEQEQIEEGREHIVVLLLVDESGSMNSSIGTTGDTQIEHVRQAAWILSMALSKVKIPIMVYGFKRRHTSGTSYCELIEYVTTLTENGEDMVFDDRIAAIENMDAGGGTILHMGMDTSIRIALDEIEPDDHLFMLVLTDGGDGSDIIGTSGEDACRTVIRNMPNNTSVKCAYLGNSMNREHIRIFGQDNMILVKNPAELAFKFVSTIREKIDELKSMGLIE